MTLTELILHLNSLRKTHGNLNVIINDDNNGTWHVLEKNRIAVERPSEDAIRLYGKKLPNYDELVKQPYNVIIY